MVGRVSAEKEILLANHRRQMAESVGISHRHPKDSETGKQLQFTPRRIKQYFSVPTEKDSGQSPQMPRHNHSASESLGFLPVPCMGS